jgi:hypothetical protein
LTAFSSGVLPVTNTNLIFFFMMDFFGNRDNQKRVCNPMDQNSNGWQATDFSPAD